MLSSNSQKRLVKLAAKKIEKQVRGESCGVACRWIKITESFGVKFTLHGFDYLRKIYQNQKRGYKIGLSPYCFGLLKVEIPYCETIYGYITEVAVLAYEYFTKRKVSYSERRQTCDKIVAKISKIVTEKMRLTPNDLHDANFGFIGKKVVITDWGFDG